MKEEVKQRMSQEDLNVLGNLQKSYDDNTDFNSDTSSVFSDTSSHSGTSTSTDIYDICGYIGPTLVCTDEGDTGKSYLEVIKGR